jgi:hypothetical protein
MMFSGLILVQNLLLFMDVSFFSDRLNISERQLLNKQIW